MKTMTALLLAGLAATVVVSSVVAARSADTKPRQMTLEEMTREAARQARELARAVVIEDNRPTIPEPEPGLASSAASGKSGKPADR